MAKNSNNGKLYILLVLLILLVIGCFVWLMSMVPQEEAIETAAPTAVQGTMTEPEPQFDPDDPNLVLVNKENMLAEDYVPDNLVQVDSDVSVHKEQWMQEEAADAFETLSADARADGLVIKVASSYRSYDYQADLYTYYKRTNGQEWTDMYSAPPGASEHQTGLAADVSCMSLGYDLSTSFGDTPEGLWLAEHAHEYGYIIRYQEGWEDITGYAYEPWHIRYVGREAAEELFNRDITLEEFLRDI